MSKEVSRSKQSLDGGVVGIETVEWVKKEVQGKLHKALGPKLCLEQV